MVDLMFGVLAGAGTAVRATRDLNNGTFLFCIEPKSLLRRAAYEEQVAEYMDYLHDTPTEPGDSPAMNLGEYEAPNHAARLEHGIELEPTGLGRPVGQCRAAGCRSARATEVGALALYSD
jgi:LDH2 family malate/lactate/ureidoglycolate dehydrogenase